MRNETDSGQVLVLAALMMVVIVGAAAFCVNASFAFYQHQRMQAMVDEQTLLAAGSGCTGGTSTLDGGTLTISSTVTSGPFAGQPNYCEGFYSNTAGGLFGSLLRFPARISVHAVAEHGGSTEPNFSVLGLSTTGQSGASGCSVFFQGSEAITITGDVYSDTPGSAFGSCTSGSSNVSFVAATPPYTYDGPPPDYEDPFAVTLSTAGAATAVANGTNCSGQVTIPSADTAYRPQSSSGLALIPSSVNSNSKVALLPYCDTSGIHPGVYVITGSFNPAEVDTISSTLVLSDTGNLGTGGGILGSGSATWNLQSPTSGPLKGYAFYQMTPCDASSQTKLTMNAGFTITTNGLFDMSCTNLNVNGGASDTFNGSLIANAIYLSGSSGSVAFNPPTTFPSRGAFLVQ